LGDVMDAVAVPRLWRMASRFWKMGGYEMYRASSTAVLVRGVPRLMPELGMDDARRGGAGVRAQRLGADVARSDDFVLRHSPRGMHLINAPSPAATASLAIGEHMVDEAVTAFAL